ncbi:hypothetical protein CCUG62472_02422 [Mycobacteroides salmoniphilum]|nr:hypothetical protein CCUG62472_02422 [Mycobacteroides salmoniphilum]
MFVQLRIRARRSHDRPAMREIAEPVDLRLATDGSTRWPWTGPVIGCIGPTSAAGDDAPIGVLGLFSHQPLHRSGGAIDQLRGRTRHLCARPALRCRNIKKRSDPRRSPHNASRVEQCRTDPGTGPRRRDTYRPATAGYDHPRAPPRSRDQCRHPTTARPPIARRGGSPVPSRFQYTVKDIGRPAGGTLRPGGTAHELAAAFAAPDRGRGKWPYCMTWNWGAGYGKSVAIRMTGARTDPRVSAGEVCAQTGVRPTARSRA